MRRNVSSEEALKAARLLRDYCQQYNTKDLCAGCAFIITNKNATFRDCCRLDFPVEEWDFRGMNGGRKSESG